MFQHSNTHGSNGCILGNTVTTYHMSIGMAPFKALYRYGPFSFMNIVLGNSHTLWARNWLEEGQDILRFLKENLQRVQNQPKIYADKHQIERSFKVGDLVYLRLQPYKQSSLTAKGKENSKPRFYGPYRVTCRIGEVAYELELLEGSCIHNVFHVSCLKKAVGQNIAVTTDLSPLKEEGSSC